ncbi:MULTISPECIES: hypothetical protein [unclassified Amycolatopsis]|uniref:hypothetical protein n=1 Tax=unclassified Amycolatopsis TaxID=2618356 RepID=UPI002876D310|nr:MULTISPECIES: hypothetical protein [unclassified Amycolatopsis]MDS0138914.1 hypothetical protein [Amycolatopsis sp. 505]MDS0147586.1 hypothetical protein [Amycolatopsis sp. CM201R]
MTDIAGMKAELDGLVREQADRRALREQQGEEIKARSHEYMTKQVQAAERYVQHVREMAQRKTKSGWSTDRSHAEPASAFDAEAYSAGFEPAPQSAPPPVRGEPRAARRPRAAVEEDEDFNNPW